MKDIEKPNREWARRFPLLASFPSAKRPLWEDRHQRFCPDVFWELYPQPARQDMPIGTIVAKCYKGNQPLTG